MMPVFRPTADCIWKSFRSSQKKHLVLTGSRGSGKTTLFHALFPAGTEGLTTWAVPGKGVYLKNNRTGETIQIASSIRTCQVRKIECSLFWSRFVRKELLF